MSAICEAIHCAAGCVREVADLWTEIGERRLTGAAVFAKLISQKGGLRDGMTVARARDRIWIFNDPTLHHALVRLRGWRQSQYRDWFTETMQRDLLG